MQLTYNKFKQVVDRSSEKVFNKLAEAIATSENAALVSMYDDKLIILDENKDQLYLCDYVFESSKLTMHNFEKINLTENDSNYLNEVVSNYFDLDDEKPITVGDMMTGFKLKFKNESNEIFTEAKDRKYRKIMESPRINAIRKVRRIRNMFKEDIKSLMEESWMQGLMHKVETSADSVPSSLEKVSFKTPYKITVNTDPGSEASELIRLRDNDNADDAMKGLASKISDKWKSDSFRGKFEKMINQILATESIELAKTSVLQFLDENKDLFLLSEERFSELITKTTLMLGEGNSDAVLEIFNKIMESRQAHALRHKYFKQHGITEAKLQMINEDDDEEGDDSSDYDEDDALGSEPSKDAGNDLESEDVSKILDIFKKIEDQLEDDSPEKEYVEGLISSLEGVSTGGIEDSKMKEIIDFLSSAKSSEAPAEDEEEDEDDEEDSDSGEEMEL